jgi:tetratricopeptide (TPR) repeat protein
MKFKYILFFLASTSIAFAQKKEIRKMERAIENRDVAGALAAFNSIDPNTVEDKYAGQYQFYKAYKIMFDTDRKGVLSLEDVHVAETALEKARELQFTDVKWQPMIENLIQKAKFAIANEKVKAGEPEVAMQLVEELYQSDPTNLDMLYSAGNLAYNNNMYDKAIEKYDLLLDKKYTGEKTNYLATSKEGVVENFPGKTVRDVAIKTKSHTNPVDEKTASNLGDIVLKTVWLYVNKKDDKQKAKTIYERALKNHPNDTSLKLAKADIFLALDMMEEYQDAVENMGSEITDHKVFDNLGTTAFETKNYESAIRYFNASLELEPKGYVALVNISNSYLESGNLKDITAEKQKEMYSQAVIYLEKAHEVKPAEKGIISTLVSLYDFLDMKDKSAAMKAKM